MLTFFQKLLGKQPPKQPTAAASARARFDASPPMPTVEVAHLSLAAIVASLPEEVRSLVRQEPDGAATVALPIPTIVKQLPGGAVRISLATLHRQAPAGVFAPLPPGDKRTVSVPLAEIFRHVNLFALKRRMDQRPFQIPQSDLNLFGRSAGSRALALAAAGETATLVIDEAEEAAVAPRFAPEPPAGGARGIAPPADYFAPTPHRVTPTAPATAAPEAAAPPAPRKSDEPPLRLPLEPLAAAWPDEIRSEISGLNGSATVALPAEEVAAGLAKGKVAFTWGQIRACIEPAPEGASSVDAGTPLTLPLKVVAPAFLAAAKQSKPEARKFAPAEDIPPIFADCRASTAPADPAQPVEAAPAPDAPPIEIVPCSEIVAEEPAAFQLASEPAVATPPPAAETPAVEAAQVAEAAPEPAIVPEAEPPRTVRVERAAQDHPPAPSSDAAVGESARTIGAVFGEPDRQHWTPADIVSRLAQLPGVAGAVVALQEGLLVAHSLPADVKGEVVAAFLPQVFARLNQYAGEMKLGEVDDLLFTTRGAHCQIYRLGFVYLAILGKPGESLPWTELRLVAGELAKQSQPS